MWTWRSICLAALPLWLVIGFCGLEYLHQPLFVALHQGQNTSLPSEGCLSYEPSFGRLFASYRMSREELDRWVSSFPVKMEPYDNAFLDFDAERLGFTDAEASYATPMASNGNQLRVYYSEGVMYVSYNVM
ncbi:MAG: hypothetical protein Aurels2KO_43800 [Aureliella sp.]